ncbi:hypothetical protein H2201_001687 [Coniosporium apollinis]|uniref:Uncharacterized protein n=1 Tax=Coniosporium apollinis TaxID=61459 RepID=A0ABQ9P7B9_9PEZI|nr:hypothetical protein H2201_001687 [Coniosporium apollinis]
MQAPSFLLYLPPTPIKPRFVLEEATKTFYDVDTQTHLLKNPASWVTTGLSRSVLGSKPAIVFPNPLNEASKSIIRAEGLDPEFMVGRLVSIERQDGMDVFGKVIGKVNVRPLSGDQMNGKG